jgi:hypothetical protein
MNVALTIDVEGDFGTDSLRGVDEVLPPLLDGFDRFGVRGTFFVVGDVAKRRPRVVRSLIERGHVVGSHSLTHPRFSRIPVESRRKELAESRGLLQDVTGAACVSFRAPYFDLPHDLGPLLEEAGYEWSSSKAPFSPVAFYRHRAACDREHALPGSRVWEIPVPGFHGLPLPEGLSYRRLFWPIAALPAKPPRVFYLHPYDLLDAVGDYHGSRWLKPLMTARQGAWSQRHFWSWIAGWKTQGATFDAPRRPASGA